MGRFVAQAATPTVDANSDALLSSVGDVAKADVSGLTTISVMLNCLTRGAALDLSTKAAGNLNSDVVARGSGGTAITVAATGDNQAAVKADINLATKTTNVTTKVRAKVAGTGGNAFTLAFVNNGSLTPTTGTLVKTGNDYVFTFKNGVTTVANFETLVAASVDLEVESAGAVHTIAVTVDEFTGTALAGGLNSAGVTITEVGNAVTIHYASLESTVAQVDAAISAQSTLIDVLVHGTGATILNNSTDNFTATALVKANYSIAIDKSVDGVNWASVGTVTQGTLNAPGAVEFTLSDANGMPTRAKQVRATQTVLGDNSKFSLTVAGDLGR